MSPNCTIGDVIRAHAAHRPDAVAILAPGRNPLPYAALAAFIDEIRARLNGWGIGRGDRIALAVAPRPEMAVAHIAVSNSATSAPIDPNATAPEIENALVGLRANVMIASDGLNGQTRDCASRLGIQILTLFPRLDAPAGLFTLSGGMPGTPARPGSVEPDDVALATRTSGTTSKPKVVPISHSLAVARGRSEATAFELSHNDRCLNFRPLHLHSAINAGLMVPLSVGGGVILPAGFDAGAFFDQLDAFGATWFLGSPAYHDAILEHVRHDPALRQRHVLRFVRSSSYRLAPEAMAELEATFGVPFLERLGGTESGLIARNPPPPARRKPGTVGVPVDNEVALLGDEGVILDRDFAGEIGEILVRGAAVFKGYEDNPDADAAAFFNGWYRTGDVGKWDGDGYLIVCGRVKDVINRGGQKISPTEVEDALLRHPQIAEVACFAMPHPTLGEEIAAAIVVADPAQGVIDATVVGQFLAPQLAAFKIPKRVVCCEVLPRGPTGKLHRLSLANTLGIGPTAAATDSFEFAPEAFEGKWEAEIAAIWRDILKRSTVGIRENFFVLGGESLMAARLLARIGEMTGTDLPLECIFGDGGTVAGLAELVRAAENGVAIGAPSSAAGPIVRRGRAAAPLSFSQERLRFLSELDANAHIYNMQGAVRLTGSLKPQVLRRVLNAIVARHEILRASFPIVDGELRQSIAPEIELDMPVLDLTGMAPEQREDEVQRLAREEARQRYDLARGPLIGAKLIKCADDDHVLLLPKHHLVFDGQSGGILYREIAALYGAFARNEPSPLAELPIQFGDYAAWQRGRLSGARLEAELFYWLDQLQGAPPLLDLPTDRPRPDTQSYQGGRCWFSLSNGLTDAIDAFSRRVGVTPFITLLAGFELLLHSYSGQDDFVLGTVVGGRTRPEVEELLGLFVNTLPLRARFDGVATVADHVARVRQVAVGAYAHQDMPFDRLVSALNPDRNASYAPVVQVLFGLMPKDLRRVELDELTFERMNIDLGTARFDLSVMIGEDHGAMEGFFEYSGDLFDRATIERLLGHYQTLLEGIVANPDQRIGELPLLTESEKHQLLVEWNDTKTDYPKDKCIHQLFEDQVNKTPDATAVVFEDQRLTYHELNQRSNQLARYLQELGVGRETLVGLCLERSIDVIVGLLAILKAGGAYVPLDPSYPKERLDFMIEDAGIKVLLTNSLRDSIGPSFNGNSVSLDSLWSKLVEKKCEDLTGLANADNLAYVIYTSGSTGIPKGVAIQHRALCNHMHWLLAEFPLCCGDRVLLKTPYSFDASVWEIFAPLLSGAQLVIARADGHKDPSYLVETITTKQITVVQLVPSLLNLLLQEPDLNQCKSLKYVFCGGERLSARLHKKFSELMHIDLVNLYGPTEACIDATYWRTQDSTDLQDAPIGKPIANTQVFILDGHLKPVPIGVSGELHIGGDGLARGYLNRPELTQEKFIANPFSNDPADRLYKTGDLARYLPDGNIEFLGRIDDQVKIRGYRIELGEIKSVLTQHSAIQHAVVLAREDIPGDKRLAAYVVTANASAPSVHELRSYLQHKLPDYMVPSAFVFLESLPLTPNGKLDRKALPAPDQSRPDLEDAFAAPRTPVEEMLTEIWAEVLKVEKVGIHDNFFHLGGHSLLATQVISRVNHSFRTNLPLRRLFESPTIAGLADSVQAARRSEIDSRPLQPILPLPRTDDTPLSFAQERLWFLDRLDPDSPTYNVPAAFCLTGELNVNALEKSLNEVARRHECLRTVFTTVNDNPVQKILPSLFIELTPVDLSEIPENQREPALQSLLKQEAERPFDLSQGPLIRACLWRLAPHDHVLALNLHHIISDGWSMSVLFGELSALYQGYCAGRPVSLPELPVQYADYAIWQRGWLQGENLDNQLSYWQKQLDSLSTLQFPTDHPRPAVQTYRGASQSIELSTQLSQAIKTLGQREGVTLFMTLLAAFQTLLCRYSSQEDIAVGTPIAGRTRREIEGLIGFFVNTLVLRTDLADNPTFKHLLRQVRETTLDAYTHQDLPFEKLVEELHPERNPSISPLFQVMFILQNNAEQPLEFERLAVSPIRIARQVAKFDLTLSMSERQGNLRASLNYNTDLFDASTIERMLGHFQTLLEGIVANPEQPISELPLLTEAEKHQLLVEWNNTKTDYPADKCIHQLFETQVEKSPDALAVTFEDQQLTYRELNNRSNQLARDLQKLGVGPEVLVGICLERSIDMVVGLLAILKAGGAYLPLDPDYPKDRLDFMLKDAHATVLLTNEAGAVRFADLPLKIVSVKTSAEIFSQVNLNHLSVDMSPNNTCYVIYTSGSTGLPKGVSVSHRAVSRLVINTDYVEIAATDTVAQVANVSFDAATFEIWGALLNGARLVLLNKGTVLNPPAFSSAVDSNGITTLFLTTSLFHQMVDRMPNTLGKLRHLLFGGEMASPQKVKDFLDYRPRCRLLHVYGPTETTTFASCYWVKTFSHSAASVPIGKPIANTTCYILDPYLNAVPINVVGEIHIGGPGLAHGYLNHPELTAEKFIANPFSNDPQSRLYKTGDLARYLPDGNIEFLGRIDNQVKIRGYRIELGEIEAVLAQHPAIQQTVVVAREDTPGDKRLVGYVVSANGSAPSIHDLRSYLQHKLPDYMVPSAFVFLESLPLTPNGKLDRKALPAPDQSRPEPEDTYVAPRTPVEKILANIWTEVLNLDKVGIHDNFFHLGGHSLLATQIVSRIRDAFKLNLPLRTLFEVPTIQGLAKKLHGVGDKQGLSGTSQIALLARERYRV